MSLKKNERYLINIVQTAGYLLMVNEKMSREKKKLIKQGKSSLNSTILYLKQEVKKLKRI